ncbi:hypothetical protein DFJ74DRAFT_678691 [Hyaloraphidium curvatum]|nr:hypothetical protein DFJ74DRAFT_678691 [Hyaloraphidium curvatum]
MLRKASVMFLVRPSFIWGIVCHLCTEAKLDVCPFLALVKHLLLQRRILRQGLLLIHGRGAKALGPSGPPHSGPMQLFLGHSGAAHGNTPTRTDCAANRTAAPSYQAAMLRSSEIPTLAAGARLRFGTN